MKSLANRRGFLGFLGVGAVGGPAFVKETLAVDHTAHVQGLAKGLAGQALGRSTGEKAGKNSWGEKTYEKSVSRFSYRHFERLKKQAKQRARLEFIKRNGLSPYEIESAENDARQGLAKNGIPPHIKSLRSFSEVRKHGLAYDYYLIKSLEHQILRDELDAKGTAYRDLFRRYTRLFIKPLNEQQYGKNQKQIAHSDDDYDEDSIPGDDDD